MPTAFDRLSRRLGERGAAHEVARTRSITALDKIYERTESLKEAQISASSYDYLDIEFETLQLDEHGKTDNPTVFFYPKGVSWVPTLCVTDVQGEQRLKAFTDTWDGALTHPFLENLESQVSYLSSWLEHMFSHFQREIEPSEDSGPRRTIRQLAEWVPR